MLALPIYLYFYLSIFLPIYLPIHLSPSIYLFIICIYIYVYLCLSINQSINQSIYLSIYLSIHPSSATHLPSLISTHLQIPFACQLANLGQYQNICSHLICIDQCHTLPKQLFSLNEICSAQNLLGRMQNTGIYGVFFQYPRVGVDLLKSFIEELILQCPYDELSTVFVAHKFKRRIRCTHTNRNG